MVAIQQEQTPNLQLEIDSKGTDLQQYGLN